MLGRRRQLVLSSDSDSESDSENPKLLRAARKRKQIRIEIDSSRFEMAEADFRRMFRLSRHLARQLIDELATVNPRNLRSSAVPFEVRCLAALSFFATGSFQSQSVIAIAQSTMCASLQATIDVLLKLMGKYVRFPSSPGEVAAAKSRFMEAYGMPEIVGAVDGVHVQIKKPPAKDNCHLYCSEQNNPQQMYSLNVMAVCNADMEFVYANAQYPGSVTDSEVWHMANVHRLFANDGSTFIVGDAAFSPVTCLLAPVADATEDSDEERYNVAHRKAHSVVVRSVALLRSRFRCLRTQNRLHYSPATAGRMVYCCMLLHNICVKNKLEIEPECEPEDEENVPEAVQIRPYEELEYDSDEDDYGLREYLKQGLDKQKAYINWHFAE